MTGIRGDAAEANTGSEHAIDLRQDDRQLRSYHAAFSRNIGRCKRAGSLVLLSGKKPQCCWYLTTSGRHGYRRLAVGSLARG
jgi:hypothetical protein